MKPGTLMIHDNDVMLYLQARTEVYPREGQLTFFQVLRGDQTGWIVREALEKIK